MQILDAHSSSMDQNTHFEAHNILIIDQGSENCKEAISFLKANNIKHFLIEDQSSIDHAISAWAYSLILIDISQKSHNGFKIFKRINRLLRNTKSVPTVGIGYASSASEMTGAFREGASEYILSPYSDDQLQAILFEHNPLKEERPNEHDFPFLFNSPINEQALFALYGLDYKYLHTIMELFLKTIRTEKQQLSKATIVKDYKEAARIVHKIKPGFAMVGLTGVKNLAEHLEFSLKHTKINEKTHKNLTSFISAITMAVKIIDQEVIRLEHFLTNNKISA